MKFFAIVIDIGISSDWVPGRNLMAFCKEFLLLLALELILLLLALELILLLNANARALALELIFELFRIPSPPVIFIVISNMLFNKILLM